MNIFKQHVPPWRQVEPQSFNYETQEELLSNEIFDVWRNKPDFYRFSCDFRPILDGFDVDTNKHITLMVEKDEGKEWWVLGYLMGDLVDSDGYTLPRWEPKYKREELSNVHPNNNDKENCEPSS